MAQSSTTLHESPESLDAKTIDRHRAIVSLMEELEAVDWYDQRVESTGDPELRGVLVRWGRGATPDSTRPPTLATPSSSTFAGSSMAPSSGRRASMARWSSACAEVTSN